MARRRSYSEPRQKLMLPDYAWEAAESCIIYGRNHHYQSMLRPAFTKADLRSHFIQPADWPVLDRAAEMRPDDLDNQHWRFEVEVEGWSSVVELSTGWSAFWPKKPTREIPERSYSPLMEELHQWVEHRRDVVKAWSIVYGLIEAFNKSGQQLSVLKQVWPDFDLLLTAMPGYRVDPKVKNFTKQFKDAGRPRWIDMPVPHAMTYLEEARRTVLAMTVMPAVLPPQPETDQGLILSLVDKNRTVEYPWSAWAATLGRPTVYDYAPGFS